MEENPKLQGERPYDLEERTFLFRRRNTKLSEETSEDPGQFGECQTTRALVWLGGRKLHRSGEQKGFLVAHQDLSEGIEGIGLLAPPARLRGQLDVGKGTRLSYQGSSRVDEHLQCNHAQE